MSSISLIVFIASIVCLIVGLISPDVFRRWFGRNINRKRIAMIFGGLIVASFITTGAFASPSKEKKPQPKPTAVVQETPTPKIETKEETKLEDIEFQTENKDDSTLEKGQTKVQQEGKNGTKETKFKVTYTDGKETAREKISETTTIQPVNKIVLTGTKEKPVVTSTPAPTYSTPTLAPTTTTQPTNTYTNVDGNTIESPSSNQSGATAKCRDGSYSHSQHRSGTCSGHGGVAEWL